MARRLVLAVLVALLACAGTAHAYVIGGPPWPGHTIRYFNGDLDMARPVAIAIQAWNTSGADIRFVPARPSNAQVVIRAKRPPASSGDRGICGGYASVGHYRSVEYVDLDPKCTGVEIPAAVTAHELGHILGLDHAPGGCAAMTPWPWEYCHLPKLAWQYRCRFVQPDDVRGAIALYGGQLRKKPAFCDVFRPPGPATALQVSQDGRTVSWHNPPLPRPGPTSNDSPRLRALVAYQRDSCPKSGHGIQAFDTVTDVVPGRSQSLVMAVPGAGTWCVGVLVRDQFGRGSVVTTTVTVAESPLVASFAMMPVGSNCFAFRDTSTDKNGSIVDWRWDFGDNTPTVASQAPTHCYALFGLYVVRLTVTDDHGLTASWAQSLESGAR